MQMGKIMFQSHSKLGFVTILACGWVAISFVSVCVSVCLRVQTVTFTLLKLGTCSVFLVQTDHI